MPTGPVIIDADAEFGDEAQAAVPPKDVVVAETQANDDAKLQKLGWRGIGVSENAARLMESFEGFAGGKIVRTIDATHGSMMRTVASAAERMVWLEGMMNEIQKKEAKDITAEDLMKLQMFHELWKDCAAISTKCNGEATKAAHIRVMMAAKVHEQQNNGRKKKAAWKRAVPLVGAKPRGGKA